MLSTVGRLGDQSYSMLYTIPASFMYLLVKDPRVSLEVPYIYTLNSDIEISVLVVLSLYSVIWSHQAILLIFGDESGMNSIRLNEVSSQYLTYFATGVSPEKLPDTSSTFYLIISAVNSPDMNWRAFIRFVPAALLPLYYFLAWVWLSILLMSGSGDYIGAAFWLVLFIFIFGKRIAGYLPTYIPEESAEKIDEAAYIQNQKIAKKTTNESTSRPRLQNDRKSKPSFSYREK